MDKKKLPVEIYDKELPEDINLKDDIFTDEIVESKNSGFANALFLGAIMAVCFLWGMLAIILRGA